MLAGLDYGGAMAMRGFVGGMCVVATGLTLAALVACGSGEPSCAEAVAAAEAEVRTTPWESPEDLPGLAHPAETHWQVKALG
ncbi:hypothetical protein, partial [Asanoa sp. NPDC050611]|uniref:hypothetical protein n=1 Tax=Asanoa sp. NPDC050611 TaxID=3157098 RepID=UPI0033FA6E14